MLDLKTAHKHFVDHLEQAGKTKSTLIAYNKDIEQLIEYLEKTGFSMISEIELDHLQQFMDNLAKQGYTNKTISRKTNATKTFFKFVKDAGHLASNIGEFLKHPKLENRAPRILSKMEYRALRDSTRTDIRTYAMVEVLLQTGVTISELASIEIAHVEHDHEKGKLFIPKVNSKESRHIPLNKAAVEAINKYKNEDRPGIDKAIHLFITKTGNPLLIRNIRSTLNRYFKIAGIENATVNDIRHTFVAHQLTLGVNIMHVSRIAGHKRLSTTERYLNYIEIPTNIGIKTDVEVL